MNEFGIAALAFLLGVLFQAYRTAKRTKRSLKFVLQNKAKTQRRDRLLK